MRKHLALIILAATLALAACGSSTAVTTGSLTIDAAWVRAVERSSSDTGASYMTISSSATADRLLSASTPAARTVELHVVRAENGVMAMDQAQNGIVVPAGGSVELKPGSFHLMLIGLTRDLSAGDTIDLTLTFENAGVVPVVAQVRER